MRGNDGELCSSIFDELRVLEDVRMLWRMIGCFLDRRDGAAFFFDVFAGAVVPGG